MQAKINKTQTTVQTKNRKRRFRYYVVARSNWQGDKWQPVAGAFPTRKRAQAAADMLATHSNDLRHENHTDVVSHSALTKMGWDDIEIAETIFAYDAEREQRAEDARNNANMFEDADAALNHALELIKVCNS